MYLYNLTLQKTTSISQAIVGSFTAQKTHEIVISKGTILELIGKLNTLISKEVFGQIRKILSFRLTGNKKDYIVVGSDSGRIVILEANLEKRDFIKIHQESFGKTGCRRIVPGEYLACDPKGRAIMIGAIEKQKFVYLTSRDNENRMTISSPLEAHKSHTLCFDLTALDVGYENPLFVSLEVDYGDMDSETASVNTGEFQKILVYYEMDLGLNHVVRKNIEVLDKSAHMLIPIPGTTDGPGGVIVCYEDFIIYKGSEDRITPLPKRNETQRGLMLINYTLYKKSGNFFILSQSENGDIYKISLQYTGSEVHGLQVQYYDTINVSVSIGLIPGFLFSASESGDNDEQISSYSTMDTNIFFNPRKLKNLLQCDEINSLGCITDFVVDDLTNEGSMQIYALCGKSSRSSLRIIKQGLNVTEMASSSLPGKPLAIWSLKGSIGDIYDKYIVVSFQNATLVLSVGETGFDSKKPSLHVGLLEDNTYIQIFPSGIIHIKADKKKSLYQTSSKIMAAASNQKQIAVALQEREIMYFEQDEDKLTLFDKKVIDTDVLSLDIGPIPEGRTRSKFLAVGCADNSVRILSLEIEQCLSKISMQMLPASPESVSLLEMKSEENEMFLNVGLNNGVLMKTSVDIITGALSDTRTRYLGKRSVSLFKVHNNSSILAVSSKSWLSYIFMSKNYTIPLIYDTIEYASSFSSEQCQDGIVAISENNLRIFYVERLGEIFNQTVIPLRYTPRKIVINPENNNIITIESDINVISKTEKEEFKKQIALKTEDLEYIKLSENQIGVPYIEAKWASCIRMIDPYEHKLLDLIEFEGNEAAFSTCIMTFSNTVGELFLIVGTAKDMKLHPRSCTSASLIVFAFKENGNKIEFLHRTPVEDVPLALAEFQGRLLVGVGNYVRLYEIGKKKLLKKCETKKLTSTVTALNVSGQRIFTSTMNESFHILRYKPNDNQFYLFADDALPRWLSCSAVLDYDTIAGCDKFENFFVYRIPQGADEENEEDPMGTKYKWEVGYLNGAAYKLDLLAQFHRGEMITQIKKCSLSGGNENVILYLTSMGSIGVFMPFETREEVDFFVHLEMYMRMEVQPLAGRDHQMFRSIYGPVKCIVDGDLCEEFSSLPFSKQKVLATELDKTPSEISKKIEEIRNKIF